MSTGTVPPSAAEALDLMETLAGVVADTDAAELPARVLAGGLAGMERVGAVLAAAQAGTWPRSTPRTGTWTTGRRPCASGWSTCWG